VLKILFSFGMSGMAILTINGPLADIQWFIDQYNTRPVGFGLLNTLYPQPSGLTEKASAGWRRQHWGLEEDERIRMSWDDERAHAATLSVPQLSIKAFRQIAHLFPHGVQLDGKTVPPADRRVPCPKATLEILDGVWHRCLECGKKPHQHVNNQCLFAATHFVPRIQTWRTVYGDYVWTPSSGSYVKSDGPTTTSATTRTATAVRKKPTATKKKP